MSRRKKSQQQQHKPSIFTGRLELAVLIAIALGFYAHSKHFEFVQDDSFITFRYVKNLIAGHGLVFNIGERVEGYTTFLWTILLAIPAKLGIDLIWAAHILGIMAGMAALYMVMRLSHLVSGDTGPWGFSLIAAALTACNSSIAYWTTSGMETAMFMLLIVASAFAYLKELKQPAHFLYTPILFVLLSLTRPDGVLLFGLTFLHFAAHAAFRNRENLRHEVVRGLRLALFFGIPIALFMGWRLMYYGWLFPNTYYAKAGFSQEYLSAGIDYFTAFSTTYMWYGVLLVVPVAVLLWRRRTAEMTYLIGLTLGYMAYVVSVGGDVLHAYRFFVPVLPLLYLFLQEALRELHAVLSRGSVISYGLPMGIAALIGYFTFTFPYEYVRNKWMLEIGLVSKMTETGNWLKTVSTPNTVVAASTIGAIAYYSDVTLIDMLGLTDETIAHYPEKIEGIESGWKERKYNNTYLLSRQPEWIFFSTGSKPSAFAERALFIKPEFRRHYYPAFFHLAGDVNALNIAYKRSPVSLVDSTKFSGILKDPGFINDFYAGMNNLRTPAEALKHFARAVEKAPDDFASVYQEMGVAYRSQGNQTAAEESYQRAVSINPAMIESRIMLGIYARDRQDTGTARGHFESVVRYNPEYTLGWMLLGEYYVNAGDPTQAQTYFRKALGVAPNNQQAYSFLTRLTRP